MTTENATVGEVRRAFGDLSDAALAGLAGMSAEQKETIEQAILTTCYPNHAPGTPFPAMPPKAPQLTDEAIDEAIENELSLTTVNGPREASWYVDGAVMNKADVRKAVRDLLAAHLVGQPAP